MKFSAIYKCCKIFETSLKYILEEVVFIFSFNHGCNRWAKYFLSAWDTHTKQFPNSKHSVCFELILTTLVCLVAFWQIQQFHKILQTLLIVSSYTTLVCYSITSAGLARYNSCSKYFLYYKHLFQFILPLSAFYYFCWSCQIQQIAANNVLSGSFNRLAKQASYRPFLYAAFLQGQPLKAVCWLLTKICKFAAPLIIQVSH